MQGVVGTFVLVIALMASIVHTYRSVKSEVVGTGFGDYALFTLFTLIRFVISFAAIYGALFLALGIVWVFFWLGAYVRDIAVWLMQALILPWGEIFSAVF